MNGTQIEHILEIIDRNIDASMGDLHTGIADYLNAHLAEVARELDERGYVDIPTKVGPFRISREDVLAAA